VKAYSNTSRKTVEEDRIAICPRFGCESIKRVKPLKFGFFGFEKYPKCKNHHVPLVYIDERIGDFVDGALACLFDKAGLPPKDLLECVKLKHPKEITSFVQGWIYCITIGRGISIVSQYLDTISNAYLKNLTKKQVKALKKNNNFKKKSLYQSIRNGMTEISHQYTRLLKQIRAHSEIIQEHKNLKPLSNKLRKDLDDWQKSILILFEQRDSSENLNVLSLTSTKIHYDQILNVCTCRCLLGLNPEISKKKVKLTAFGRFSAYFNFYIEGITKKFTKLDIENIYSEWKDFKLKELSKEAKEEDPNSKLEATKEILKNINWQEISDNWNIQIKGQGRITLNPYKPCSNQNPLYMHKKWLVWIYLNDDLNLSDRTIAKICGLKNHKSIQYWRNKFNIQTKEESGRYLNPDGYVDLYMPKSYEHPELNPLGNKRIQRREHIVKMEEHLMNSLSSGELDLHPYLIGDSNGRYYIKTRCIVHHINYRKRDNYIENLWLYANHSEHNNNNINPCLSGLIKLGQTLFSKNDNQYILNSNFDYTFMESEQIKEIIKTDEFIRFDNIQTVRDEIKKMDWSEMKWYIVIRVNKLSTQKIFLNPLKDCSEENPLYKHKGWVERILSDSRFNLTDPRLARLCRISESTAYRWRSKIHKISLESWGFKRYLHKQKNRNQIWTKVPKNYKNPFVLKKPGFNYMLEHRYILEKEMARQPEKYNIYLVNDKYLKPECRVQHINLDSLDNRIQNLHPCRNQQEHEQIHSSLFKLIDNLLKKKLLIFSDGRYLLNY
jgi:hypothetical protein